MKFKKGDILIGNPGWIIEITQCHNITTIGTYSVPGYTYKSLNDHNKSERLNTASYVESRYRYLTIEEKALYL